MAGAQTAQHPGGPAQWTQTQPTSAPSMPQMVPPLHQPLPGQPATLYQQVVQLPKKPTVRGVAFEPPTGKTTPVAVQVPRTTEDLTLEGGEVAANPSVTQGRVRNRHIRRVIGPPDQCQVSHHQRHLKEPSLGGRSAQICPLGSGTIYCKVLQCWLEEGPGACALGLLQIQRCLL